MDEHAVVDFVLSPASFTVAIVGQFPVHDALGHIIFNFLCVC